MGLSTAPGYTQCDITASSSHMTEYIASEIPAIYPKTLILYAHILTSLNVYKDK